jgi:parallel beta-helix repeat protein
VTLTNSRLLDNVADIGGGFCNQWLGALTDCTLSGNTALGDGGGIENQGTFTLTNCTATRNTAGGLGGGIDNAGGHLTVVNSTLSGNSAFEGGAIANQGNDLVINSTLARNQAVLYGGGIYSPAFQILQNTIIAGNQAPNGPDVYDLALANSSLIENPNGTSFLAGSANNITGQDPVLGSLQQNGGPTLTLAILPGSPAIDAGDNSLAVDANGNPLITDQRGEPYVRVFGNNVDIGAYEFSPIPVSVTIGRSVSPANFGEALTFAVTVSNLEPGSPTPTGGIDLFDTTTATDLGTVVLSGGAGSLTTNSLPLGTQTITASYSGDAVFLPGSASVPVSILPSIYVLDPTANPSLGLTGNAALFIPGVVQVNSSAASALTATGNGRIQAGSVQVVGGFVIQNNASISPAPITGVPPVPDPLAGLSAPSGGARQGSVNLTQGSQTIDPGIYDQIQVSGSGSLTLNPGIYVIAGGGLSITDLGSITGSGVLIYNAGSNYVGSGSTFGPITLSGHGTT